jgi:large subunit ribosomal protein L5
MNQLKEKYLKKIAPEMAKKFKYQNLLQVPKLVKVVVSRGVSEGSTDPKATDAAALELSEICGQHAMITKAKKAIAAFKLRARDPIGCVVTLRGERMYHFFNKLVNISLPKVRDFRGLAISLLASRNSSSSRKSIMTK